MVVVAVVGTLHDTFEQSTRIISQALTDNEFPQPRDDSSSEDKDEYSQTTTATTESVAVADAEAPDDCSAVRYILVNVLRWWLVDTHSSVKCDLEMLSLESKHE